MIPKPARNALLLTAGALLLCATGCRKVPPPEQAPLAVNVVTVSVKDVTEWDEFTGRIEAVESVDIHARVGGYLQSVNFQAGALVNAGDLLFVIDPRPYQADFDRAQAEVDRAESQVKLAEIDHKRAQDLRQKSTISAEEFDQKAAALRQAEASARSAAAAKQAAALNLEFTQIRSPIAGRVSNERVTAGNLIMPGGGDDTVLTTVVSVDPLYVYVDTDENTVLRYIKLREEGKRKTAREERLPAFMQLANETGFPHEGYIDFVDNRLDPNTGTLRARGVFKNWNPLISPGFFVRMRVRGAEAYKAALIDDKVISSQQGVKYVFVVKPDNTIERRNIETGPMFEGLRIVRSGLEAGERVVSTRLQMLQPGMTVVPVAAETAPTPAPAQ